MIRRANSARKTAKQILAAPQQAIYSGIAALTRTADVSKPAVNRFCHRMGAHGFPDFKLQLAQRIARAPNWVSRYADKSDNVTHYSYKIFDSALADLNRVRQQLDMQVIDRAVNALTYARKVAFLVWRVRLCDARRYE